MMRIIALAATCLSLSTAVADAKSMTMTDGQLDKIVAGDISYKLVGGTITNIVTTANSIIITVLLNQGLSSISVSVSSSSGFAVGASANVILANAGPGAPGNVILANAGPGAPGNVILAGASVGASIKISAMVASP